MNTGDDVAAALPSSGDVIATETGAISWTAGSEVTPNVLKLLVTVEISDFVFLCRLDTGEVFDFLVLND